MKKTNWILQMAPIYILLLGGIILGTIYTDTAITTFAENRPISDRKTVIIDAGHGGVDGGTTSCTGVLESHLNLEISLRLNDLMHLLGIQTYMIRTTDDSVYTSGNSISEKKISDLKERVRIANNTSDALLISIHQNYFPDDRYSGGQVFYAATEGSKDLAVQLQSALKQTINPGSNRNSKPSDHIYLMSHVSVTAVLIECGFLSNPQEEAKIRDSQYQKELCAVICATVSTFL